MLREQFARQVLDHQFGESLDGRSRDAPQVVHPQPFGQMIPRQNFSSRCAVVVRVERLSFRIAELPAAGLPLRLAGEQHRLLILELLDHPRLIEPHTPDVAVATIE